MKSLKSILAFTIFTFYSLVSLADVHTTKYLIFVENGKQAGEQIVQRDDNGLIKVRFIFKDYPRDEFNAWFTFEDDESYKLEIVVDSGPPERDAKKIKRLHKKEFQVYWLWGGRAASGS